MRKFDDALLPHARWSIIRTLGIGGMRMGATDKMILEVVNAEYVPPVDREWVRDELLYLEDRRLVHIERSEINPWRATLTRYGSDIYHYQIPVEEGIARPNRHIGES